MRSVRRLTDVRIVSTARRRLSAPPVAAHARPAAAQQSKRHRRATFYVRRLSPEATDDDLRKSFGVESVSISRDAETGASRGFGFVTLGVGADHAAILNADVILGGVKLDIFPEFRNRLTGEIVSMRTAADLLKLYEAHATRFNEVHLSTALQRFSQLRGRAFLDAEPLEAPDSAEAPVADEAAPGVSAEEQTLLDALCDDCTASMVAQTSVWQSRGLANVALSLAKLWVADEALFDAVAKRALQLEADAFTPECAFGGTFVVLCCGSVTPEGRPTVFLGVATLAQGFARANAAGRYDALYDVLSASAQRRISDFGKRELSALALGFAIGRCSSPQQRYSPLSARPPQEDDDEDDERRTKAKSFQDAKLFDAIEKRSMQLVEDFGPEDLSMTANAFAVVLDGRARSGLFEAMARRAIVDGVLKMSDVNLAHLARAFAVQKPRIGNQQRLFRAIANAVPRLQRCGAQSLWSLAHAFSAADAASAPLFQHIHAASLTRISTDFSPKGVALLAHAFSQASFDVPDLYAACAKAALDDIDHFSTTHLAMLARSLATVGYLDEDLFRAITEACEMRVDEMDLQSRPASWIVLESTVSLAWAYAVLDIPDPALFETVYLQVRSRLGGFTYLESRMLYHAYVYLRIEPTLVQHPLTQLLMHFEEELREVFVVPVPLTSPFEESVSAALHRTGWAHERKHCSAEGLYLDMVQPETILAVECLGPQKFLRSFAGRELQTLQKLHGKALAKRRILKRLGWSTLNIPYFEWDALDSPREQERYINDRIGHKTLGSFIRTLSIFKTEP